MNITSDEMDVVRGDFLDEVNQAMNAEFARLRNKYGLNDWAAFYEYREHEYCEAVESLVKVCCAMLEDMLEEQAERDSESD